MNPPGSEHWRTRTGREGSEISPSFQSIAHPVFESVRQKRFTENFTISYSAIEKKDGFYKGKMQYIFTWIVPIKVTIFVSLHRLLIQRFGIVRLRKRTKAVSRGGPFSGGPLPTSTLPPRRLRNSLRFLSSAYSYRMFIIFEHKLTFQWFSIEICK